MKVRVYLATTEGPVEVERITREAARQSAVCLKRTTKVLAASAGYDAFVKQPSGVIEREFGPFDQGAFRLDVSGDIGDGDSWQLGVFVAHALAAEERLAGPEDEPDAAIWLTGEVRNDLGVAAVAHVEAKLQASRAEFARLKAQGVPVTAFVPRDNWPAAPITDPPEVAVSAVDSAREVLAALALEGRGTSSSLAVAAAPGARAIGGAPGAHPRVRWLRVATALVVVALVAAAVVEVVSELAAWRRLAAAGEDEPLARALDAAREGNPLQRAAAFGYRAWFEEPGPMAALVEVAVLERRAPAGKTCAAVHFGTAQAATVAIARRAPDRLEASLHDGLCGLEFSLTPRLPELYAAAFVELSSGRFIEAGGKPGALDGRSPLPPRLSWSVDVPRRMSEPIVYRLVVVAAAHPVADAAARLREGAQPQAAEAASGGATVISLAHRVVP